MTKEAKDMTLMTWVWFSARWQALRDDDRGQSTVEMIVIAVGLIAVALVAVAAVRYFVTNQTSQLPAGGTAN